MRQGFLDMRVCSIAVFSASTGYYFTKLSVVTYLAQEAEFDLVTTMGVLLMH